MGNYPVALPKISAEQRRRSIAILHEIQTYMYTSFIHITISGLTISYINVHIFYTYHNIWTYRPGHPKSDSQRTNRVSLRVPRSVQYQTIVWSPSNCNKINVCLKFLNFCIQVDQEWNTSLKSSKDRKWNHFYPLPKPLHAFIRNSSTALTPPYVRNFR